MEQLVEQQVEMMFGGMTGEQLIDYLLTTDQTSAIFESVSFSYLFYYCHTILCVEAGVYTLKPIVVETLFKFDLLVCY